MISKRLQLLGDAFALFAFVTPITCLTAGVLPFAVPVLVALRDRFLFGCVATMFGLCGLGGLAFILVGAIHGSRRFLLQGLFGLCIALAPLFISFWLMVRGG